MSARNPGALNAAAGQVLREADRIERNLKAIGAQAQALFESYVSAQYTPGNTPWRLLDTHHRHIERRCHTFDFDLSCGHDTLEQLVAWARERTMQARRMSSRRWSTRGRFGAIEVYPAAPTVGNHP